MNTIAITNFIRASILIITCLILIPFASSKDNISRSSISSVDSLFHISIKSKIDPIPLNKIHQWVIHVSNSSNRPVENAKILIDGGMPIHNHGLPTQPMATEIGQGDYLIEGIKFSMTGVWEVWFYISTSTSSDKVKVVLQF